MLKTSLGFVAVALIALLGADLEVLTLSPWDELGRMASGFVTPDWSALWRFREALLQTVVFALCGTSLGAVLGAMLATGFHWAPIRAFCALVRSIHELFWALLFLPLLGLNAVCGLLAIAIPYAGIFAKVYAELIQESDARPREALPAGTSRLSGFFYAILPVAGAELRTYTAYRFECALRSSAILGFIGLPTLGFHLETALREGLYSEAGALLIAFYLLIGTLRWWLRAHWVPVWVLLAWGLLPKATHFSWENLNRFLTWEILPWPVRREGFYAGTQTVQWNASEVLDWAWKLAQGDVWNGVLNTLILTQIVLVATGLLTLVLFPGASRRFASPVFRRLTHGVLIVLRTTPEYLLAYGFVLLWGPSMLPAIAAIALHNGAILAFLVSQRADQLTLRPDAPRRRLDRYGYEVLPRLYGPFLALLFYRWEIMMRESALLGMLGIATLGFYIDSGFAEEQLDVAVALLAVMAVLNLGVDQLSQVVRRRIRQESVLV